MAIAEYSMCRRESCSHFCDRRIEDDLKQRGKSRLWSVLQSVPSEAGLGCAFACAEEWRDRDDLDSEAR